MYSVYHSIIPQFNPSRKQELNRIIRTTNTQFILNPADTDSTVLKLIDTLIDRNKSKQDPMIDSVVVDFLFGKNITKNSGNLEFMTGVISGILDKNTENLIIDQNLFAALSIFSSARNEVEDYSTRKLAKDGSYLNRYFVSIMDQNPDELPIKVIEIDKYIKRLQEEFDGIIENSKLAEISSRCNEILLRRLNSSAAELKVQKIMEYFYKATFGNSNLNFSGRETTYIEDNKGIDVIIEEIKIGTAESEARVAANISVKNYPEISNSDLVITQSGSQEYYDIYFQSSNLGQTSIYVLKCDTKPVSVQPISYIKKQSNNSISTIFPENTDIIRQPKIFKVFDDYITKVKNNSINNVNNSDNFIIVLGLPWQADDFQNTHNYDLNKAEDIAKLIAEYFQSKNQFEHLLVVFDNKGRSPR